MGSKLSVKISVHNTNHQSCPLIHRRRVYTSWCQATSMRELDAVPSFRGKFKVAVFDCCRGGNGNFAWNTFLCVQCGNIESWRRCEHFKPTRKNRSCIRRGARKSSHGEEIDRVWSRCQQARIRQLWKKHVSTESNLLPLTCVCDAWRRSWKDASRRSCKESIRVQQIADDVL